MKRAIGFQFLLPLLLLAGCGQGVQEHLFEPAYFDLPSAAFFPTVNNVPSDNRLSVQGVKLGRCLFYDPRLGGAYEPGEMLSCASCHRQENGFDCGVDNPRLRSGGLTGAAGQSTAHVALPLVNLAFNTARFGWGRDCEYPARNIEDIVAMTLTDSAEFAGVADSIVKRIQGIDFYPTMFEEAFGTPEVTYTRICMALAQFVRTLVSSDSRFDRYMRGEGSLTDEELKGYVLFTTEDGADCFHCHGGAGNMLFSTYEVLDNGLEEKGGFYRIPTLRNIGYTAPYMHDGRFTTLEQVIDQYSENVRFSPTISPLMHHVTEGGVQLTDREKSWLKAFLLSLNDAEFIRNPDFSNPFENDTLLKQ